MTTALARTGLPGVLRADGYTLPADLSFEEWAGVLNLADHIVESSPWWLVDAILYGERHFGERHTQAFPTAEEDPNGKKQARLKQAAWMASVYPTSGTRVPGLSYTHHRAAAELEPEQRQDVLREAARDNLTTRQLIARVREVQEQAKAIDAPAAPVCAAEDDQWRPTPEQLTESAAARMRFERAMAGRAATFEMGWTLALAWAECLDAFARD